jgi:lysophospholipase L1-like esterase
MGDSRMRDFQNEIYFDNHQWNIGKGFDTTRGLIDKIPDVLAWRPDIIVISTGINDVIDDLSGTQERMRTAIQGLKPYTGKLIITNIVPETTYNKKIIDINLQIKQVCSDEGVIYLDLIEMEIGGALNPLYSIDGIHYNTFGYNVFANAIKKEL